MEALTGKDFSRQAALLFALVVSGAETWAQQTSSAKIADDEWTLEEVIVTAERREQSAQDVAVSVSVFNQDQLNKANIVNSADLANYTPSLSINTMFGPENAAFNIRGFSKELRTTATVGVYFAEVVAPRGQILQTSGDGAGPGTMYDLQNIQVLKGPQGTLFGRNTTGGAVIMTPQKPTEEFEGYVELSGGNYDMLQQQAVLNVPLSERLRFRLGLDNKQRDGYLNNITNIGGDKFGDVDYTAGRLSMILDVTDSLEEYLLVNYVDSDTKGYASRVFACDPHGLFEALRPGLCAIQLALPQDDFYDVVSTVPDAGVELEDLRVINHLTWAISDNLQLKNILAYMHLESTNSQDVFGTWFTESGPSADPRREFTHAYSIPVPEFPVTSQETYVAELQLQGDSFEQRLEWQAGIYYENSKPDGFSGNLLPSTLYCDLQTITTGDPQQFNCNDPANGAAGGITRQAIKTEYTNQAVYSQASYAVSEHFDVTLGLRYTKDKTEGYAEKTRYTYQGTTLVPASAIPLAPQSATQSDEAPTGLVELQYHPGERVMLYAKYVRGYRQGSVNIASDIGLQTFDKETVDNIEVGLKSEFLSPLPGRFNIAAFDNKLSDMQLQSGFLSPTAGSTTAIFNAGEASIKGIEFDGYLELTDALSARFSFSYLDTRLEKQDTEGNKAKVATYAGTLAAATFTPTAVVGDELPFTPEKSYTFSLDYRLPLSPDLGELIAGATYAYTGEQRATASTFSPYSMIDDFAIVNVDLSWLNVYNQPLDISLFVTNVRDEEYVTFRSGTYHGIGFDSQAVGQPRMYGARLKYHF